MKVQADIKVETAKGNRIVYTDEAVFSRWTRQKKSFSHERDNYVINENLMAGNKVRLVVGISKEKGLEGFQVFEKPIDTKKYVSIIP